MISVSSPREYVPSGRKLIQRHPDFNISVKPDKEAVTSRFKDIDLNDSTYNKSEQWYLRETCLTFECPKNVSFEESLDSQSTFFTSASRQSSNNTIGSCQTGKYELNTNKKIINNFINIEEELYVRKNILIWSKGSSTMIPDNLHNNSRVLISSFTTQNDIKQVVWCKFFLEKPKLSAEQENEKNDVKVIPSICMIDRSSADYCNNLYIFSKSYEDYQFSLEFKVSKIFATKFGVILIRDLNKNSKSLNMYDSLVYSLVYPLDQLSSILIVDDESVDLFRDPALKILFTNSAPSFCFIFNKKSNLHSVYLIRRLTDNEINAFLKNNQSYADVSYMHKRTSKLMSPVVISESKDDFQNLLLSNLTKTKLSRTLSSSLNISQSSILSPNTKLNKSKVSQSFKATDSHMEIEFGPYVEDKLNVDICLEHIWTESSDFIESDSKYRKASRVFVSADIMKQMYLCYLISSENTLHLIRFHQISDRNFQFLQKSELVAKDAINVPKLCMFAVLDMSNQVNLYTGSVYVGRLQINNSFSPTTLGTPSHFKKKHFLDRFQNARLIGLKECINKKLILEYEDENFFQIEIPPFFTSNLIEKTLCTLKNVLTKDNALALITQWYRKRNTPGIKEFSIQEEWELFEVVIMSMLGYRIETSNDDDRFINCAKKQKPTVSENRIWSKFLESPHHTLIGKQVIDLLHLKHFHNTDHKKDSADVIYDYDSSNTNATLLSEFQTILYSLHLLYEDLKLNQVFTDHLVLLATFLDKLAIDFALNQYSRHYRKDFPSILAKNNAKNRQLGSKIQFSDHRFSVSEPPDIMNYLYQLLSNVYTFQYPYVKNVNPRSKHIVHIYLLILRKVDMDNTIINDFDATTTGSQNMSILYNIVEYMTSVGITNEVMESLPIGVSLPIYEVLWKCRANPPPNWSTEAYGLIYREDLQSHMDPNNDLNNEDNYKSSNIPYKRRNSEEITPEVEIRDGMEDIENSSLKYRFTDDKRVRDVRKMFQSCEPVKITIKQKPEISDNEFVEEQEKHLYAICARTMALPVGRAMFTMRTMKPIVTEMFPIPKLCLHGKLHPIGTTIDLTHIDTPAQMNTWPLFHNGVASGLRISPNTTNINSTWIVFNRPKALGESSIEHAGFLMALGLNGHLQSLNIMSLYEYLIKFNKQTSIGLLLGLSASKIGTKNVFITKMLSIHVEPLIPPTSVELEIPQDVQIASILGIGLLYQGTFHRYMAEVMLNEIGRSPGPEMEHSSDRDSYSLAAGLALGMIALKQGSQQNGSDELKIYDNLYFYIFGGSRHFLKEKQKDKNKNQSFLIKEGNNINVNITAPGALIALALIYLDSNNCSLARMLSIPDTQPLLECVRPDLLLLRVLARDLIMWSEMDPKIEWVENHVPEFMKPYCLKRAENEDELCGSFWPNIDYETMNQAYCNIVIGACLALGLRFAGTENREALKTLMHYCKMFMSISKKSICELAGKTTIETCLNVILVSMGMIMAGSGNIEILRICRYLRSRIGTTCQAIVHYGSQMAIHMTIGLLFLGGGRYTLSNSPKAVAALLCAFFPKFPSHSNDNRYHLQAFRHFYVLATEPRLFLPKSILTNEVSFTNIKVLTLTDEELFMKAPCLLPPTSMIKKIQIYDQNMLPIVFERNQNWNQLSDMLLKNKFVCIKSKSQPPFNDCEIIELSKSTLIPFFFYSVLKKSSLNEPSYGLCVNKFLNCSNFQNSSGFIKLLSMSIYKCLSHDMAIALTFWIFMIKNLETTPKPLTTLAMWQLKLMCAKISNENIENLFIPIEIALAVQHNLSQFDQNVIKEIEHIRNSYSATEFCSQRTLNYLMLNDLSIDSLQNRSSFVGLLNSSNFDGILKLLKIAQLSKG